jgi:hypothetical protein
MGKACNTQGRNKDAFIIIVRKVEGKRPLGRCKCNRKNNIKMDPEETYKLYTRFIWLEIGTSGGFLSAVMNVFDP